RCRPPNSRTAVCTAFCTAASSVTSVATKRAAPPSSAASAAPASWFRSAMTTRPPAAANRRTQAAPSPELPPVTRKVLFAICMGEDLLLRRWRIGTLASLSPFGERGEGLPAASPLHHRVAQHAELLDLHLGDVAALEVHRRLARHAHPRRRPREDQIPRLQRADLRDVSQRLRHAENHLLGVAVLHRLAVEAQLDVQR